MAILSSGKSLSGVLLPGVLLLGGMVTPAFAAGDCTVPSMQAVVGADTTIVSATVATDPVPYCSVEGYVTTQNPGPNKVGFLIGLPEHGWNGRFFFNSVGGSVGFLQKPPAQLIVAGYAVATTDAGHRSNSILDWSGTDNPARALDMAKRSIHVSAVAGQAITKSFYRASSMYRYVQGCSGGGTRTLNTARFNPGDFDGFIAEAPGISAGNILAFANATQYQIKRPGSWVPPAKLAMLEEHVNQACGAVAGVVPNSLACKFDPTVLQCKSEDKPDCLTAAQVGTIQVIAAGPRGPHGQLYPGAPYSNTSGWVGFFTGPTSPPWSETDMAKAPGGYVISHSFMKAYLGQSYDYVTQFDINNQKDIDAYLAGDRRSQMGQRDSDLSALEKAGGKIIFWHGMSDPGISFADTVRYYTDLHHTLAGEGRVEKFARLFPAPGVLHCSGGTGPTDMGAQTLQKMVEWVEKGLAPEAIVANRTVERGQVRQFLSCAYPKVAVYHGNELAKNDPMAPLRGDPAYDANNYRCE